MALLMKPILIISVCALLISCATNQSQDDAKLKQVLTQYLSLPGEKAFYISRDGFTWINAGWSAGHRTLAEAKQAAYEYCENERLSDGHRVTCEPYYHNNIFVLGRARGRVAHAPEAPVDPRPEAQVDSVDSAPRVQSQTERPAAVASTTVRQIQYHLKTLGFDPGPVDGFMGPRTAAAIRSFQKEAGIEPDGLASTTLEALLAAIVEDRREGPEKQKGTSDLRLASTGSGFFINDAGHVLTNHHVIEDCSVVRVGLPSGSVDGAPVAKNPSDDLAVIRVPGLKPSAIARLRGSPPVLGEDVIVIGYPLRSVLGGAVNVTFGAVSSTSGLGGDRRYLQITAPVQQGNSGGPLLDEAGAVVGVVVSKLDVLSVARATGDIPQNINFGIKAAVAQSFLSIHDIPYQAAATVSELPGRPAVVGAATEFTVPVECWK